MSFQAYIDNIKIKTGLSPQDFIEIAKEKRFVKDDFLATKAKTITDWLQDEFELGHGHAMAIYATIKQAVSEDTKKK
jgi:heterodisulfide reductase subunit A-like polyferredoxin